MTDLERTAFWSAHPSRVVRHADPVNARRAKQEIENRKRRQEFDGADKERLAKRDRFMGGGS